MSGEPRCRNFHGAVGAILAVALLSPPLLAQNQGPAPGNALAVEPPAHIAVSPARFELDLGSRPAVESLRLFNFGNEPVDVRVSVATWDLDEDSRVRIVEPTEQSLDQWIIINPLSFTIGARASQTVRFSVRPRVRPEPGEHRAMLYFEQVLPEDPDAPPVRVNFKIGVAVYGFVGEPVRSANLHAVEVGGTADAVLAAFDISSEGNAHVRLDGQYAIWPAMAFVDTSQIALLPDINRPDFIAPEPILAAGRLPTTPVLPGTRRSLVLRIGRALESGRYVLTTTGTLGGETFVRAVPFTVAGRPGTVKVASREGESQG